MLRSAAVAIIQRGLGFRSDLSDEIVSSLQMAQRLFELGRSLPDFLKEQDATLTVTEGTADIALPTGFIREVDGEGFHFTDADSDERIFLEKFVDLNLMRQTNDTSDTTAGRPRSYYIRKATIVFMPERDADYDLIWSYYKQAEVLSSDVENAWLANAPEALIGRAGMLIAEDIGLSDAAMQARYNKFKSMYETGWSALFSADILREEANYPRAMGARL